MRSIKLNFLAAITLLAVISVGGQETPVDLARLVRQNASTAERELRSKGYVQVSTYSIGNGGTVSRWWSDSRNECITVTVRNNRVEMILTSPASDCGRSDGGWYSGTRPPNWAVGTWYWNNANERVLVIEPGGKVWISQGGVNRSGWYRGNRINVNGEISTLSRNGNGIRLINQTTGETSDYFKAGSSGGSGGGWEGGGSTRPPSWAVGNWIWVDGRQRRLDINSNGRVVAWDGRTRWPGTYSNGIYTIANQPHTLTRVGSRIRLFNQVTGDTFEYRRR